MVNKILHKTWLVWLLITGLVFILYAGTLKYDMLYNFDDDAYFADIRITELNTANVKDYFSDYYLGMYQPLPVLSFAIVYKLFPGSMQAQRMVNLLFHCINILLVLLVVKKLSGNQYIAIFTALFFAIHPMQVESIAWISARSNLMFSGFYLGAVLTFASIRSKPVWWYWVLVYLLFLLALFSKVTAATLPGLLLLIHRYLGRKFNTIQFLPYLPLFLLSGVFIYIGIQASSAFGHITDMGQVYTITERLILFFHTLGVYLYKFLAPVNQSVLYLFPIKENGILPVSYFVTAFLTIAATASLIWVNLKMRNIEASKAILFGIAFFLITISIVMPLKWSRTIILAERYTYLPYIGLSMALLMILFHIFKGKSRLIQNFFVSLLVLFVIGFVTLTFLRNKVWENPDTLFTEVIENSPGKAESSMAYYNRGNEFFRLKNAEKAISDYSAAIKIYPAYHEAFYNRGLVFYLSGENNSAIDDFTSTIAIKDDFTDAYINRGAAYRNIGMYDLALSDLDRAISLHPSELAYLSRGVLYFSNLNNPVRACNDWSEAAKLGSGQAKQLLDQYCAGE